MAIFQCVTTADAQLYYARFFGGLQGTPGVPTSAGLVWDPRLKFVRWGEGGWIDEGLGRTPRVPSPSLRRLSGPAIQEIDSVVDTTRSGGDVRYPATERATFAQTLLSGDFSVEGNNTIVVRAFLDFGDFNDDGYGNPPEVWEVGVFADHPTLSGQALLVAYGTFTGVTKTPMVQIERRVKIRFGATT